MDSTKDLLTTGRQYFDNRQYDEAESYFRRVLEQNEKYADVHNMIGVIAHIKGRFASAMEHFRKAIGINPNYTEATLNLAVLYNDLGQYTEAKKLYSNLQKTRSRGQTQIEPVLRGKLSNLHADIGDIYRSIGLYNYAIEEYNKALNLNPNYFDIRTKLGQALRENGHIPDSIRVLKEVLRANDRYIPALIQLGISHYAADNATEAKKSWQKVLENEPDNEYARMYLRLCEVSAGPEKKTPRTKKKIKR